MGQFLNPSSDTYARALRSEIYVDKTGMLSILNKRMETMQNRICSSRPRRFGKSMAVDMITAYYSIENDSRELFKDNLIGKDDTFETYLNRYDVLKLDMLVLCGRVKETAQLFQYINEHVIKELNAKYPNCIEEKSEDLEMALLDINLATGKKFIIVIDEWDAVFRIYKENEKIQKAYIDFLRSIFKDSSADQFVALAYITGILPIKKYGTQSALNNFEEYTMVKPGILKEYMGFTEWEVQGLCEKYHMDFQMTKEWYDGYRLKGDLHIYSPKSIVDLMLNGEFYSYWTSTETYESLLEYINMNFEGLRDDVIKMLAGEQVPVNVGRFKNDMMNFTSRNDVLTLLIHLGYLAYDEENREVYIPNNEIKNEFENSVLETGWTGVINAIEQSKKLLRDTLNQDAQAVASALEKIHEENTSILKYNDENSLSLVITLAYYSAKDEYLLIRELPAGKGYADVVFLPKHNSNKPALIVELKYNKEVEGAIAQIHEKSYMDVLKDYVGKILLTGISYESNSKNTEYKRHKCVIEEWDKNEPQSRNFHQY